MNALLKAILFTGIFVSCQQNKRSTMEPARQQNIPDTAFWVGGVDGGNWYVVGSIHSHRNNAYIRVYDDQTGDLILSKKFILVCPDRKQILLDELKTQINAFDGEKILLKSKDGAGGCWLQ